MKCFATKYAAGPCKQCRQQVDAPLHLVGEGTSTAMYCPEHCPLCTAQTKIDWGTAPAATVTGEQGGLW